MHIDCGVCQLRPLTASDVKSLARYANNRKIWIALRDRFPHPYRLTDAAAFIAAVRHEEPPAHFGIVIDDEAIGTIGAGIGEDIERTSAEIGYWIGEPFWGRGLATAALRGMTAYAFERLAVTRVFALPFAHNAASIRVLEKAGYVREGILRRSAIKDGIVCDQQLFACYDDASAIPDGADGLAPQ